MLFEDPPKLKSYCMVLLRKSQLASLVEAVQKIGGTVESVLPPITNKYSPYLKDCSTLMKVYYSDDVNLIDALSGVKWQAIL